MPTAREQGAREAGGTMTSNTETRAQASARELADVPMQLAALGQMRVGELAARYRDLYGEPTRSRNKEYLKKRLAWRIQELAEGGLSKAVFARVSELGDGLPERWRRRQATATATGGVVVAQPDARDPRLPPEGSVLRRTHLGVTHEVTVGAVGFIYAGERFKTLSAIAKRITGTAWNGFAFFGCAKRTTPGIGSGV